MRLAALVLSLLVLPAAALAAEPTPYPPQPTPLPGEPAPVPTDDPASEVRGTDTLPPDMLRRPQSPPWAPPSISPTAGVALTIRTVRDQPQLTTTSADLWLGARFHPVVAPASPFVAFGTEINFREMPRISNAEPSATPQESGTYTEWVPEMRVGFAWLRTPTSSYFNHVFPNLEVYAIGGWRLPNEYRRGAARLGAGFSAPPLLILLAYELPLPTMLEFTMDLEPGSEHREYAFRFGWHF